MEKEIRVMKRNLFFLIIFAVVIGYSCFAGAGQAVVRDFSAEYVAKGVKAEGVKGVEIKISKEIIRYDCNKRFMSINKALVSGDGSGWYDKYIVDASVSKTLMHCPIKEPVRETISAAPIFIKSFTNENVHGDVIVTIVIPKGYNLEATAVR
jgi:hypothetical protein